MLGLYLAMAKSDVWPDVPQGENIKPGGSDPRIPAIREILILGGDHPGGGRGETYDPVTVEAMQKFQKRHGLEAKGLIGKQTVVALNVPPDERARQIMLNMERWRWMPEELGDYHYTVNLAAYELYEVKQDDIIDRMDVVVGAVATQTPEFTGEMTYVEINPTWTVPYSIATKEMLPRLRRESLGLCGGFRRLQQRQADLLERHQLERLWTGEVSLHLPPASGAEERSGQGEVHAA